MDHDPTEAVALHRYSVIAQAAGAHLSQAERGLLVRALSARPFVDPVGEEHTYSRSTIDRWIAAYRRDGLSGLAPVPRSDKGRGRVSPELMAEDVALRRAVPTRSAAQIAEIIHRAHGVALSERTLREHLRRSGVSRRELTSSPARAFGRFEAARRNEIWIGDVLVGPFVPHPRRAGSRRAKLFVLVDDHSRLCVGARFYPNQQQAALDDCFQRALVRWGVPCNVYVDRGNVFVSKHFERVCAEVGTHLIKASVGYPEGKGKVERLVKTVKSAFYPEAELLVKQGKLRTLEQLNEYVDAFVEEWYNRRPHSELAGKSPREVWGPEPIRPVEDLARIKEAFLWRLKRQVQKDCCFQVEGVRFRTCPELARQKVEVAYDPLDLSYALVYQEGVRMDLARPEDRPAQVGKRQQPEVRKAPPSGLSFLELLRKDHEDHLKQELAGLSFRQPPSQGKEPASRLVVVRLLEGVLHRPLNHLELARVEEEWRRGGPLDPTPRAEALARLVADIGPDRHIGEYLKCLRGR